MQMSIDDKTVNFEFKMGAMDYKLNELFKLREIQDQVITLRTEVPPMYGKYLKEEASIQMKNLINSDVILDVKPIEKPNLIEINVDEYKAAPEFSTSSLNEKIENLAKCFEYYKKNEDVQ